MFVSEAIFTQFWSIFETQSHFDFSARITIGSNNTFSNPCISVVSWSSQGSDIYDQERPASAVRHSSSADETRPDAEGTEDEERSIWCR